MASIDAFIAAAASGNVLGLRTLLAGDRSLLHARNMFGYGAIHAAHFAGERAAVAYLDSVATERDPWLHAELADVGALTAALDAEPALVEAFNQGGSTLLHAAAYFGQAEVARLLLDRGADPNAATRDSFLHIHPLGNAVASPGLPGCPAEMEENVLEVAAMLLDAGAGVNNRRHDGLTALHTAAHRGHMRVAELLLDRGADPAIRGHASGGAHGEVSAAEMAEEQGHPETARLIRERGG